MKALDVLGSGAAKVAAVVKAAVTRAARVPHVCDGFHCDCERRAEVAAQARGGDWLPDRKGWLKRERE
jgi:hypothetical protein